MHDFEGTYSTNTIAINSNKNNNCTTTIAKPTKKMQSSNNNSNTTTTIALPKAQHANNAEEISGGVQDTIYLCNFRVSVDGEWLCLKELQDLDIQDGSGGKKSIGIEENNPTNGQVSNFGIENNRFDGDGFKRDWANYCRWLFIIKFI